MPKKKWTIIIESIFIVVFFFCVWQIYHSDGSQLPNAEVLHSYTYLKSNCHV